MEETDKMYPEFKQQSFSGRIGVSNIDITPPVAIFSRNWGLAEHDVAEGIHRPLMLTCVTFQSSQEQKPLVLISADICVWRSSEDGKILRNAILEQFDIPASNLMFCLTHTHSGPVLSREAASKPGGQYIDAYLIELERSAIKAVTSALENAGSAVLTWQYGLCNLAFNRDLREAGSHRYIVGLNKDAPADNTLLVGRITDGKNRIIGTIVNYACHPTTLAWQNRLLSPDYVGSMRELVELNTSAPCLFLQGASGELAPAQQYVGDTRIADKNGRQLGYAVLSTLESMLPPGVKLGFDGVAESGAPLACWKETSYVPSHHISAEVVGVEYDIKALPPLAEINEEYNVCEDRVAKERLWRKRSIRINLGDGDRMKVPLWIWRLGDSLLVGQSNEAYSEFQEKLRKELAPAVVAVINLVNGSAGYLPPKEMYEENIYQVWQSPFAAGSLEELIEVASKVSKRIINES